MAALHLTAMSRWLPASLLSTAVVLAATGAPPISCAWGQSGEPAPADAPATPDAGDAAEGESPAAETLLPPPSLGLDSILRPRGVFEATPRPATDTRGGRTRAEWGELFEGARQEVGELETRVDSLQQKLRTASSGEWGYSPIGSAETNDPEVQRLRAELKRDRRSLDTARTRLRDLEVEASLAGVPDDWRKAEARAEDRGED